MSTNPQPGLSRRRRLSPGWGFTAPYTLFLVAFGLVPVLYAIYIAFQVTPVVGASYFSPVENFIDVLKDNRLPTAALNVGLYLVVWLPLLLLVIFAIALVADAKRTRLAALTRFVAYVPGAITGAAAALVWMFMFSPAVSPFAALLKPFAGSNGLLISNATLPAILAVLGISIGAGGWIVLVYGALTAIPSDILEAARIDGANAWQTVLWIKLPYIRNYIAFILIVSIASGFQVFVEPAVIGAGANGQVSSTWAVNQIVYTYASGEANYGRASALALIMLAVCIAVAVFVLTKTKFYSTGER